MLGVAAPSAIVETLKRQDRTCVAVERAPFGEGPMGPYNLPPGHQPAGAYNRGPAPPDIDAAIGRLGPPREWTFYLPMQEQEFGLLDRTGQDGRWHDATILVDAQSLQNPPTFDSQGFNPLAGPGAFVAIAKPWYPPGVYRYPSGAAKPGEGIVAAALREAAEETGLEVQLTRYLLSAHGAFYLGNPDEPEREHPWQSHVFLAEPVSGDVAPKDRREIREACVVGAQEMLYHIHPKLLMHELGGFSYRVGLQERALHALGLNHAPWRVDHGL